MAFPIQLQPLDQLDERVIAEWRVLEMAAWHPNAFLSPHAILPAAKYLTPNRKLWVLTIRDQHAALCGLGVFERRFGSRRFPLPHWCAYATPRDIFMTGLLLRRDTAEPALRAWFDWLVTQPTHGVVFEQRCQNSPQGMLIDQVAREQAITWVGESYSRPILDRQSVTADFPADVLSKNRRKKWSRAERRLRVKGTPRFELLTEQNPAQQDAIDQFLQLENLGWKADAGSALAATSAGDAFLRSMCEGFANAGRLAMTRLWCDDRVVGTTCNLLSGNCGFAYKLGWDPTFRDCSPGMLQELYLGTAFRDQLPQLDQFDSCCDADSFLDRLWPGQRVLGTGVFPTTLLGRNVARARHRAAAWKKTLWRR